MDNKIPNNPNQLLTEAEEKFIERIRSERPEPSPVFQERLLEQILQSSPLDHQGYWKKHKIFRLMIVFALLLVVVLMTSNRSWATDGFNQILSVFNIQRETDQVNPDISAHGVQIRYMNHDQVQALVDFPVTEPNTLPEGYQALGFYQVNKSVIWVSNMFSIDTDKKGGDLLILQQDPVGDEVLKIGQADVQMVTIHNQPGLWIRGVTGLAISALQNPKDSIQLFAVPSSFLVWKENGVTYTLHSNQLQEDEMLLVADSIR